MERIIKQSIACIAQNVNAGLDETARAAGVWRRNRMPTIMGGGTFGRHSTDPGCGADVLFSVFQDIQR